MKTKDDIRHDIRVQRAKLTLEAIATKSRAAIERLEGVDLVHHSKAIACYLSKPFEVQTQRFIEQCVSRGKRVCVPRRRDDAQGYAWSWVTPRGAWRDGPWHIAEPALYQPVDPAQIEVAIVPAVAVDRQGNRLGHGGGNFDRLLQNVDGPHLALVFDFQVLDAVPVESHDVPVQWIVTDTDTYSVQAVSDNP